MGNASSIDSSAVVYLDINGKQEKVSLLFLFLILYLLRHLAVKAMHITEE